MTGAEAALIAVAGFLAGGINAIAGGGSLVSFPALVAIGLPTLDANVTNTTAVWPGYLGGVVAYRAELADQRDRVVTLTISAALGAAAGCVLLLGTSDELFDAVVPALIVGAAGLLFFQPRISTAVKARLDGDAAEIGPALHGAVFLAAIYGAYFGGGLGVILLAVLGILLHDHLQRLNALKSMLSLLINTVALVAFALFGPVDWQSVAIVAPASLAGGYAGARVARRMSPTVLRTTVVAFALVVAVWLVLR